MTMALEDPTDFRSQVAGPNSHGHKRASGSRFSLLSLFGPVAEDATALDEPAVVEVFVNRGEDEEAPGRIDG